MPAKKKATKKVAKKVTKKVAAPPVDPKEGVKMTPLRKTIWTKRELLNQ